MSASLQTLDLAGALDQILPATGTDPEYPHLMSVLIEGKDGSIRFVATDRHRLAVRDLVPSRLDGDFTAVVPAATLAKWRSNLDEPGEVVLGLNNSQLELSGPGRDLTASVVPVTFPDYEQFLAPSESVTAVEVDRERLLSALQGTEPNSTVIMATSEGSVRITDDRGSVDVEVSCDGPSQRVAIKAEFLADAIRNAVGTEVVIEIEDALSPVLFRSADDGTFTSRVMPIKVD